MPTIFNKKTEDNYNNNYTMRDFISYVSNHDIKKVTEMCKEKSSEFNIDYVMPVDLENSERGHTALSLAVRDKHHKITEFLIKQCGANTNTEGAPGITPLYSAVNELNEAGVDILLDNLADPNFISLNLNFENSLLIQPLAQLSRLFKNTEGSNKIKIISIANKLIVHGANTTRVDPEFLAACHATLISTSQQPLSTEVTSTTTTTLSLDDFTSLSYEEATKAGLKEYLRQMTDSAIDRHSNFVGYQQGNDTAVLSDQASVVTNQVNHTLLSTPTNRVDFSGLTHTMSAYNPWTTGVAGSLALLSIGIVGLSWFGLKKRGGEHKNHSTAPTYIANKSFEESLFLVE